MVEKLLKALNSEKSRGSKMRKRNRFDFVHDHTSEPLISHSMKTIRSGSRATISC